MQITYIENTPFAVKFEIKGVTYTFANTLRRIMINSVPAFAINTVTFYKNTSAMFDEYIAHRIGLIPILTPSSGYDEKDEILFSLEAEGPKTVYSSELKSTDKKVRVANEKIPIIKLAEGQELRLEGKAIMGTAAKSAKFQPGLVTYKSKEGASDSFEFYVESFGQMPAGNIIQKGLDAINDQLKAFEKALK